MSVGKFLYLATSSCLTKINVLVSGAYTDHSVPNLRVCLEIG
jgi:hypothetical protein